LKPDIAMNVAYINPFIAATTEVFATIVGCTPVRETLRVKRQAQPEYEVSGVIGLSGKAMGTIVLSLSRPVAMGVASAMLQETLSTIGPEVVDAVGELTNMIAGRAKTSLEELALSISLPSVILGRNHLIEFPSNVPALCVPFGSPLGPLCIEVGLVEFAAAS
jgi:chemotaxis protein CheX